MSKSIARGSATRQANKTKRRDHILACAGNLIAEQGIESFTLGQLATKANVTVPTIHNLIGKKSQVFDQLVTEMVARVSEVLEVGNFTDPIESVEASIDKLMELFGGDEKLYKAAYVAGERNKLFEHEDPSGIFATSLNLAIQVCASAKEHGYLIGKINTRLLAKQLFSGQRLARHDWMHGYIKLEEYRVQALMGMLITLAADATPAFHKRLMAKIDQLSEYYSGEA